MSERIISLLRTRWLYFILGLLLGSLIILGIRFITYNKEYTHYHANFAVFTNGAREEFKSPGYYQEVNICGLEGRMTPQMRTHMHDQENGVVHVHHDGVTWGQFFENLGWVIGPDFIQTTTDFYRADETSRLHIVLNGQNLTGLSTISNQLIGDKDRLLLSFGNETATALAAQFKTVPNDAAEYNSKPDPASCSGAHHASASDRLKHLF